MKRKIWVESFSEQQIPRYPCPRCLDGTLKVAGKAGIEEPKWSKDAQKHEDWEPDWITSRIHLKLICDEGNCAEIVHAIGDTEMVQDADEDGNWGMFELIRPAAIFPAPPIIAFPEMMPDKPKAAVEQAFAVCWSDTGSAANRIRVSVELALDELGVPRKGVSKKTGDEFEYDLNGRIQQLEKQAGKEAQATTFHALRVAGNAGSHEANDVSWHDLMDCFMLYEAALEDIFGNTSALHDAAKKRLMKLKKKKT